MSASDAKAAIDGLAAEIARAEDAIEGALHDADSALERVDARIQSLRRFHLETHRREGAKVAARVAEARGRVRETLRSRSRGGKGKGREGGKEGEGRGREGNGSGGEGEREGGGSKVSKYMAKAQAKTERKLARQARKRAAAKQKAADAAGGSPSAIRGLDALRRR